MVRSTTKLTIQELFELLEGDRPYELVDVQSITIFYADTLPKTIKGTTAIADDLFPGLELTPQQIFQQAGMSN
jgi:hypothetical protein